MPKKSLSAFLSKAQKRNLKREGDVQALVQETFGVKKSKTAFIKFFGQCLPMALLSSMSWASLPVDRLCSPEDDARLTRL